MLGVLSIPKSFFVCETYEFSGMDEVGNSMDRFLHQCSLWIRSGFGTVFLTFLLLKCSQSQEGLVREPVLNQISYTSEEICLDSILWVFPSNPCVLVRGTKENPTGKISYQLVYRLSSMDVEFPVGLSLGLDQEYYNLVKVGTEYGAQLELVSSLPASLIPRIQAAGEITISYSNRKETRNTTLSSRQRKKLIQSLLEIQNSLREEPKLKIQKATF